MAWQESSHCLLVTTAWLLQNLSKLVLSKTVCVFFFFFKLRKEKDGGRKRRKRGQDRKRKGRKEKEERKEGERRWKKGQNLPVALTRPVRLAATGKCFFKVVFCCDYPPFGVRTPKILDL